MSKRVSFFDKTTEERRQARIRHPLKNKYGIVIFRLDARLETQYLTRWEPVEESGAAFRYTFQCEPSRFWSLFVYIPRAWWRLATLYWQLYREAREHQRQAEIVDEAEVET